MKNWLFLAIAIFGEVVATSALKSSHGFTKLVPSVVVVAVESSACASSALATLAASFRCAIVYSCSLLNGEYGSLSSSLST